MFTTIIESTDRVWITNHATFDQGYDLISNMYERHAAHRVMLIESATGEYIAIMKRND
jgi:hypothetical protein